MRTQHQPRSAHQHLPVLDCVPDAVVCGTSDRPLHHALIAFRHSARLAGRAPLWLAICCVCAAGLASSPAHGHGSVTPGDDLCIIKIGFYNAHFTVFQPRTSGHEEYCEDLPDPGETLFVLNYMHDSMRQVPLDFRIVVDRHQVGRFARYEDVEQLDLNRDTVFYQPPLRQADATFMVLLEHLDAGDYIGVVTTANPNEDKPFRAVFPFRVGSVSLLTQWLIGIGALIAALVLARRWVLARRAAVAGSAA